MEPLLLLDAAFSLLILPCFWGVEEEIWIRTQLRKYLLALLMLLPGVR